MLIQDKICLLHYGQEPSYCQTIQKPMETAAEQQIKDDILTAGARFGVYRSLVETLPLLLWALFLGPFLDSYPNASFLIFLVSLLGDCFATFVYLAAIYFYNSSPYYLLFASGATLFTGGTMSFVTTASLIITRNNPEASRGIKFVSFEIIIVIGIAGSTFLSGQFLKNIDTPGPIRTYHFGYLLSLALIIINFAILAIIYQLHKYQQRKRKSEIDESVDKEAVPEEPQRNALQTFLSLDNARQTLIAFFRPRPNHVRLQILLLCFIQYSQMAITNGVGALMGQFGQQVYHWGPAENASYGALQQLSGMLMLAACAGIFISWLKFSDSNLILMAQISNFAADLIRGTFLSTMAFFISIPIGCLNGFGIIAAKTKFSKIVPPDEAGKIFTLNSLLESLVPLGTNIIYTNLFALSISTYPGLFYHFSCALMILTVGALIVEKRFCPVTGQEAEGEEGVDSMKASLDGDSLSTI